MAPSLIAAAAIRVANAIAHRDQGSDANDGNALPDIATFAKAMDADGGEQPITLRSTLDRLLGAEEGPARGPFSTSFVRLFGLLAYDRNSNSLGFPKILLWKVPRSLVHVLLFWMQNDQNKFDQNNNNLLRFVVLWMLSSYNDDKTSNFCFRLIREVGQITLKELYFRIRAESNLSACPLLTPANMEKLIVGEIAPKWRSFGQRIAQQDWQVAEFVKRWWWDERNLLAWLQRAYLDEAFPGYDPTADREDDMPYDVDHMVPRNDWRFHWADREKRLKPIDRFDGTDLKQFQWVRDDVGESIGNKWLVDLSINRGWADNGFSVKMNEIQSAHDGGTALGRLLDIFPNDQSYLWRSCSPADWERQQLPWSNERMQVFQCAVETRACWLYERLYSELGFSAWTEAGPPFAVYTPS